MPHLRIVSACSSRVNSSRLHLARASRFALLTLGALLLTACTQEAPVQMEEKLRPVKTQKVENSNVGQERQFAGVVDANQKATMSFRVSGKLKSLLVKEGDIVKRGQRLATLDATDFTIQLADRKATFDRAKSDFSRAEKLVEAGHVSRADYDKLKASLSTAQAQVDLAKQNVEYSELRAPFAGVIAKRYVDNFEEVSAQQVIYLLQDTTSLLVTIDLPESIMIHTQRGQKAYDLYAEFDAIPGERFPLKVKEVATVADDVTQTYSVSFSMAAPMQHTILPGMSTVVHAIAERDGQQGARARYFIPSHAALKDSVGNYVMLVKAAEDGVGVVERRSVIVGEPNVRGIEILEGLSPGELVVVAGMTKLIPAQRVRLSEDQQL